MKNIYIKLGVCLLAAITLIACKKENELAFSPNSSVVSVNVGETTTLSVNSYGVKSSTPYPVSGVEWSVDDKYVASVDNSGVLTGLKVGVTRACGKFDGGKVVYIDILVNSLNNQYLEPMLQGTFKEVADYENTLAARQLTRSVDSKYAVYKGTSEGYLDKFQIYFFNQFNGGVITCFDNGEAVETAKTKFLPDRYDVTGENSFADNKNNKAETRADEFGTGVFYNFGDFSGKMSDVYAQYAADAKTYIETVASKEAYTQEALGLFLPFELSVDQSKVDGYKSDVYKVIDGGTNFSSSEQAISDGSDAITGLYLEAARKWAKEEWCWKFHLKKQGAPEDAGLSEGHDESKYSSVAWDYVLELDELLDIELSKCVSFKDIDVIARQYGKKYYDIAASKNFETFSKNINSQFSTIQKSYKKYYNETCWAQMEALKALAIDELDATYSYDKMNKITDSCKANKWNKDSSEFAADSYYYDVPSIDNISNYKKEMNDALSLYKESDYTAANWKKINNIYNDAVDGVDKSVSKTLSRALVDKAKVDMFNIPKK